MQNTKTIPQKKRQQLLFTKTGQVVSRAWNITRSSINIKTLGMASGMLGLFIGLLYLVQFVTPNLAGNDGYYHIKMAYILRTQGLKPAFTWLPLTILNPDAYYDHHYLYHILLIPFTFGDLRLGAKYASVILPALSFLGIWYLFYKRNVPYAGLWALALLAISEAFLYRMSMPRAQAASLGVLALAMLCLLQERYHLLIPLGFAYVWLYNAFPLLLIVALAYTIATLLSKKRLPWQPLVYSAAGILLGLVLNPYFPENISFIYQHLAPKLGDATATPVGREWYPYKTTQILENSGAALLVFGSGILALGLKDGKMKVATGTSLILSILFGFLLMQSRRFVEYTPAFFLIFAAFAWADVLTENRTRRNKTLKTVVPLVMLAVLLPSLWLTLSTARKNLESGTRPYQRYAEASEWLVSHTPEQSRIFQTDWDDFPQLFFYNTHNTYTLGLDPTYMQLYDAELYQEWVALTQGKIEQPAGTIQQTFGSEYIISDLKHTKFIETAQEDPKIEEVYRDDYAVIFHILPDK